MAEPAKLAAWHLPNFSAPAAVVAVDETENPLYQQGYQQGLNDGKTQAEQAFKQQAKQTESDRLNQLTEKMLAAEELINTLNQPYQQLEKLLEQECFTLVAAVAEKLFQKAIAAEPAQLLKMIMQAKTQLPLASGKIELKLSAEDSQALQQCLTNVELEAQFKMTEDPKLCRGEFILKSANSFIDGTLKQRLARILSEIDDNNQS